MSRTPLPQLDDEQLAALDLDAVRCTGCTPCCMSHMHFLHDGAVLWACQEKLRRREKKDAMDHPRELALPCSRAELAQLRAGDEVLLSGTLHTMRDAGHQRALECLERDGALPFGLEGQVLFYAGPTPAAAGRPLGSVGPTTASRMDFATPALFEAGITACIGKGKRSSEVVEACQATGSVYFAAVGGIAALLARHVTAEELVAWDDLGTEALRRLTVDKLPVYVAIDVQGNDLYRQVEQQAS